MFFCKLYVRESRGRKAMNGSFIHKIQGVVELQRVSSFDVGVDDK